MISVEAWFTWVGPLTVACIGLVAYLVASRYLDREHRRIDEMARARKAAEKRAAE